MQSECSGSGMIVWFCGEFLGSRFYIDPWMTLRSSIREFDPFVFQVPCVAAWVDVYFAVLVLLREMLSCLDTGRCVVSFRLLGSLRPRSRSGACLVVWKNLTIITSGRHQISDLSTGQGDSDVGVPSDIAHDITFLHRAPKIYHVLLRAE